VSDRAQELLQNACEVFAKAVVDREEERAEDIALIAFAIAEIDRQDRDPPMRETASRERGVSKSTVSHLRQAQQVRQRFPRSVCEGGGGSRASLKQHSRPSKRRAPGNKKFHTRGHRRAGSPNHDQAQPRPREPRSRRSDSEDVQQM
jgi:hypothetical protein